MITTLLFLQLLGFLLWHFSSSQVKVTSPKPYVQWIKEHSFAARIGGAALMLASAIVFIARMGWMTGLSAAVAGLMAVGSLVLVLYPFRYIKEFALIGLYAFFLVLEFLI